MATLDITQTRRFEVGQTQMPTAAGISIPANMRGHLAKTEVDTTAYPAGAELAVIAEFTTDGGTSWDFAGGCTTVGGAHVGRDGLPAFPGFSVVLPSSAARARITVTASVAGDLSLRLQVA